MITCTFLKTTKNPPHRTKTVG
uniref:Uncharacterized protein n=1 Tax=Anguilla anguilla TaxID=7936 RepID=A0A0E9SZJ2_ANGAN